MLLFSIIFIKLNFTDAFMLIRKTWDDQFAGKVGGIGDFHSNGRMIFKWQGGGVETTLWTMRDGFFWTLSRKNVVS